MTDKTLVILSDPPAIVVDGVGSYGSLEMGPLHDAHSLAIRAFKRADEVSDGPDSIETLRAAVNDLADAVSALTGQLMQIHAGIRSGRIAVEPRE